MCIFLHDFQMGFFFFYYLFIFLYLDIFQYILFCKNYFLILEHWSFYFVNCLSSGGLKS